MTTKNEKLDAIVRRVSKPSRKSGLQIGLNDLHAVATGRLRLRDRKASAAKSRERIERRKELGDAMTVEEFEAALDFVRSKFGIVLSSSWGSHSVRPKITARELFSLAAAVDDGTTYRDRVVAVNRLQKLGFRVNFTENGPKPSAKSSMR